MRADESENNLTDVVALVRLDYANTGFAVQLGTLGVRCVTEWPDLVIALASARICVCAIPNLADNDWRLLITLVARRHIVPVLLVTYETVDNVRALAQLAVADVLFMPVSDERLLSALHGLSKYTAFGMVANRLRSESCRLDPAIAGMLSMVCMDPTPMHTVSDLATRMGCHRSTFSERWSHSAAPGFRPHLFIDWMRVVHAIVERVRTGRSWSAIAVQLGMNEKTLYSAAQRVFHMQLTLVEHLSSRELAAGLLRWLDYGDDDFTVKPTKWGGDRA